MGTKTDPNYLTPIFLPKCLYIQTKNTSEIRKGLWSPSNGCMYVILLSYTLTIVETLRIHFWEGL